MQAPFVALTMTWISMHSTDHRRVGIVAVLALVLFGTACESHTTSEPDPESLASFRVDVPDEFTPDEPFELTVTAVGSRGTAPFTDWSGAVTVSTSAGELTPLTLDITSGTGVGTFTVSGVADDVRITVAGGGVSADAALHATGVTLRVNDPTVSIEIAIPDIEYEVDYDAFSEHSDFGSVPVSYNTLAVMFAVGTSVAEVNQILRPHDAEVVGGYKGVEETVPGTLLLRFPTSSHEEIEDVIDALKMHASVRIAVPDILYEGGVYLPQGPSAPVGPSGHEWTWTRTPRYGNWGMEDIRAPALWNLDSGSLSKVHVGVIDVGFAGHEDLSFHNFNARPAHAEDIDHGLHVAGILGADFGNGIGVDGVAPNAVMSAIMPSSEEDRRGTSAHASLDALLRLLNAHRTVKVVNISLGISFRKYSDDPHFPENNDRAAEAIYDLGELVDVGLSAAHLVWGVAPLIVTSAGNRYGGTAVLNDGFANAGLARDMRSVHNGPQILAVEALNVPGGDWGDPRLGGFPIAALSNLGGHISAPGSRILSAVRNGYEIKSGTSMAAPHVAGAAAFIYGVAPDLTALEVLALIKSTAIPVDQAGAAPSLDAYAAALSIDRLSSQSGFPARSRLMDVDASGTFDEKDIEAALAIFAEPTGQDSLYSRVDFNGNSYANQGPAVAFDLNADGQYDELKVEIEGREVLFDQTTVSDLDILCYYAYDPAIYRGSDERRRELLATQCGSGTTGRYDVTLSGVSNTSSESCTFVMEMDLHHDANADVTENLKAFTHGSYQQCSGWALSPAGASMSGGLDDDRITLRWDGSSGVTGYQGSKTGTGFSMTASGISQDWTWTMSGSYVGPIPEEPASGALRIQSAPSGISPGQHWVGN